MRVPSILLAVGLILIGSAASVPAYLKQRLEAERATIVELQRRLDVATDSLRRAPTADDSAHAQRVVTDRTYWFGRRAYHVPSLEARLDGWWSLSGPGTLLALIGGVLSLIGTVRIFRR